MGALWREADLSWKDFLPEGEDVHNFLLEQVSGSKAYASCLIVFHLFLREDKNNCISIPVIK